MVRNTLHKNAVIRILVPSECAWFRSLDTTAWTPVYIYRLHVGKLYHDPVNNDRATCGQPLVTDDPY